MVKKDTVQVTALFDGKQPINQLGKLEMEYADIRRTLKGLKKDHKDYLNLKNREKELQGAIRKTRAELGLQGMTLQQLIRHTRDLDRTRSNSTTRGTAQYKKLTAEIRKANAMIRQQKMEARGMTGIWAGLSKQVKQFGLIALGYLGITTITSQISNLIQRTADYSDLLASVRKTTGLTNREIEQLNKSLAQTDTRTARKELLLMAKVAGKLGITARKDVEGFVKAFDKINVALGEDLGNPEDVARKLGKIMEAFNINEAFDIETGLLKIGSAINHLGKSSTANEGFIVEFTRRMAGIAPLANISVQDVLGLGATLDALGQTAEVSSTALNKLFIKMTQNAAMFAHYARTADGATMSTREFKELVLTDFNEAFIALLRGVKDNSAGMLELSETLGDLELDGGRIIGVLGTLANNTNLLHTQQKISNEEFEKGTSVLNEFNLVNETAGGLLEKVRKRLYAAFVNSSVMKGLESMLGWMERITRVDMVGELQREQMELNVLVRAIQNVNEDNEIRSRLIEELREKYPDFIKKIGDEELNNQNLAKALKNVNDEYRKRIILQGAEEKLQALAAEAVDLMDQRIEKEKELAEYRDRVANDPSYGLDAFNNPQDAINDLDRQLDDIDDLIVEAEKKKKRLLEAFNLDFSGKTEAGSISQDPVIDLSQIKDDLEHTMLELQRAGYEPLADEIDLNLDMHERFEKQKTQMTKEQERLRRESQKLGFELQLQQYDALAHAFGGVAHAFVGMTDVIGDETERAIEQQVFFKQAAIFASQAQAMAAAIAGATEAAAATGPAAPFALAGYIASMVGTVLSAFGQIKNVRTQADQSIAQMREQRQSDSSSRSNSYYHGGETGYGSIGMGDKYGPFTGYTHRGELVVPSYVRSDPDVIDAEKIIKAKMSGYSIGGSMNHNVSLNSEDFSAIVDRLGAYINVLVDKGVKAQFSRYDYRLAKEDYEKKENASSRGSL